jgi:hypothetical protein
LSGCTHVLEEIHGLVVVDKPARKVSTRSSYNLRKRAGPAPRDDLNFLYNQLGITFRLSRVVSGVCESKTVYVIWRRRRSGERQNRVQLLYNYRMFLREQTCIYLSRVDAVRF